MKPAVTIKVRDTCGTYLARVFGHNITASCTSSERQAALSAARKYFAGSRFSLTKTDIGIFTAAEPTDDTPADPES